MSVSAKKLAANRTNARKSTGPCTAEGKARSSRNAVTHGIFCNDAVLPGEDEKLFESFRHAVLLKLSPQDVVELMIVDRIVMAQWKLRRLNAVEAMTHMSSAQSRHDEMRKDLEERRMKRELDEAAHGERDQRMATCDELEAQMLQVIENEPNAVESVALSFRKDDGVVERLSRYEQRLELSIHRNLRQLEKLRKQSQRDEENDREPSHTRCPYVPREAYDAARELQSASSGAEEIEENEPTEDTDDDGEGFISKNEPKRTTRNTEITKGRRSSPSASSSAPSSARSPVDDVAASSG
jgi:hypothetical protein